MRRVDEILEAVQLLNPDERSELLHRIATATPAPPTKKTRSILELEGLGAEIWREMNVDAYIRGERDSWDS